jgi:hypothetical protein
VDKAAGPQPRPVTPGRERWALRLCAASAVTTPQHTAFSSEIVTMKLSRTTSRPYRLAVLCDSSQ